MKIRSARFDGVWGVRDGTIDFVDPKTGRARDLVVLTGPSACGKTRLLEALVAAKEDVAPYGFRPAWADWVRPGGVAAKIVVAWELGARVVESETIFAEDEPPTLDHDEELATALGRYDHAATTPKVDYFADSRALGSRFGGSLRVDDQRRLRLGHDARKYSALPRYLEELALGLHGDAARAAFDARLAMLAPDLSLGRATRRDDRTVLELTCSGRRVDRLELLPRSRQHAILFAAGATLVGLERSIVLVDTPELAQSSIELAPFFAGLRRLGRDNQLLVATGSSEVAAAAPADAVVRLDPSSQDAPRRASALDKEGGRDGLRHG